MGDFMLSIKHFREGVGILVLSHFKSSQLRVSCQRFQSSLHNFWWKIKNPSMNYGSSKSAKIVLSKSIFSVKNQLNFFKKKISSKNINLGDHFSLKTFFSKLNFWTTLLTKITPNFWRTDISRRNFLEHFPWWYVDSWPKILLFRTHHP